MPRAETARRTGLVVAGLTVLLALFFVFIGVPSRTEATPAPGQRAGDEVAILFHRDPGALFEGAFAAEAFFALRARRARYAWLGAGFVLIAAITGTLVNPAGSSPFFLPTGLFLLALVYLWQRWTPPAQRT